MKIIVRGLKMCKMEGDCAKGGTPMNKWFRWAVFAAEISKLEDIIQTAVRELEKQKENNRIEKFYFLQYTQDAHVTFGIKLPEERNSEVFEEIKLQLQGALNRDFTENERLNYIVPKQKSYKIENPFSMWGWINARKLHPLCKGIEI